MQKPGKEYYRPRPCVEPGCTIRTFFRRCAIHDYQYADKKREQRITGTRVPPEKGGQHDRERD